MRSVDQLDLGSALLRREELESSLIFAVGERRAAIVQPNRASPGFRAPELLAPASSDCRGRASTDTETAYHRAPYSRAYRSDREAWSR